jgi:Arc/MetJ family transcription regulator
MLSYAEAMLMGLLMWVPIMKTTVDINDALLQQAKQLAAEREQTLKSILEAALRKFLDDNHAASTPFKLRKHSFQGRGLQPDLKPADWATIRGHLYEGHGG